MRRFAFLVLALLFIVSGCATNPPTPTAQDPFSLSHFAQLQPGLTTRIQAISLFGIPTTSADMSGGLSMDTWIYGSRGASVMYKNDHFDKLLAVFNVYLPQSEKARLGLTAPSSEDRLTPKAMTYLQPGQTTIEEAKQILGTPENLLRSEITIGTWSHDDKIVSIAFKKGVMSRIMSLSNIPLSESELVRLRVTTHKAEESR